MRRAFTLFLVLVFLLAAMPSATAVPLDDTLSALCLISQKDGRYQNKKYNFKNAPLSDRGCDPCAATNLIIAAYGVTERETADAVLLEMLHLLTGNLDPATHKMNINHLARLQEIDAGLFPTLAALQAQRGGALTFTEDLLTPDDYQALLAPGIAAGDAQIVIGKLAIQQHWRDLLTMCRWLRDAGCGDAYYLITHVTGGTSTSSSPFRSSDGHYFTLLFQPDSYLADGSFYLLDSLPRALADEPNRNRVYWRRYPFTLGDGNFKQFRQTYTPTRLLPTLLRFTLSEKELTRLAALTPEEQDVRRVRDLEMLKLFGEAAIAVCIPARAQTNGD